MRTNRLALFVPVALAALIVSGCGTNDSAKTEAEVFLQATQQPGPADVPMISGVDVTIPTLIITSKAKSPSAVLSPQDDVVLNQWVVTCTRTDGGTVASPSWQNFETVYVPANGTANLQNYRIFPAEYFLQEPLVQLLPGNAGLDKETGKANIRQRLHVEIFGKTVAGKAISVAFDVNLNFFYTIVVP
jgi:hypothetical protein